MEERVAWHSRLPLQISSTCSILRRPAPALTYENLVNTTVRISLAPAWYRVGNWNFAYGAWCRTRALWSSSTTTMDDGRHSRQSLWSAWAIATFKYSTG